MEIVVSAAVRVSDLEAALHGGGFKLVPAENEPNTYLLVNQKPLFDGRIQGKNVVVYPTGDVKVTPV